MKNSFKKYLVGLSVFVLMIGLSCSKRESDTVNANPAANSSYTNAQSTLTALGLAISIPTIGDFADTTGTNTAALTSVFSGNDSKTANFDSTKFSGLESAISELENSLASYTAAPKSNLSLSPSLVTQSWQNSDLAYVHFILGYYYTVHAVLKLRVFIGNVIRIVGSRYELDWDAATLNGIGDSGRQAVLDAYFMLNGVRYQVSNSAGTGKIYANKSLPAGAVKLDLLTGTNGNESASYHLDMAIYYGGQVFPQLKTALEKLKSDSFKTFFDEIASKMTALGITELATN
ncbi:MAG: hypothetical protein PHX78_08730 [bacterium]|nr:hypothetical protein [bacterium]